MTFVDNALKQGRPESIRRDVSLSRRQRYHPSPADWRDEVLYFPLVDRFSDGREDTRPPLDRDNLTAADPQLLDGKIWRRIFPQQTPTEGLNLSKLARLNVAGGNIRNIALNGAFLATDVGEPVRMSHLLRATRVEYAKLEKPLTEAEIGG